MVKGKKFTYYDSGSGPAVVLLHSFGHNKLMWLPQLISPTLAGFRVIAPDFEGHGGTYFEPETYSMDRLADDTIALLKGLKVDSAVFVGISMGGYVALKVWKRNPNLFRGLVLSNTKAEADTPEIKERRDRQIEFILKYGTSAFVDKYAPLRLSKRTILSKPWVLDFVANLNRTIPLKVLVATLLAIKERTDDSYLLKEITVPTLITVGEEDKHIPITSSQKLREEIRNSTFVTLAGTAHVSNLEDPEGYNLHLLRYLNKLNSKESF